MDEDQTLNSLKRNQQVKEKPESSKKALIAVESFPLIDQKGNVIYRKIKVPLNFNLKTHNLVKKARKNQFTKNIKSFSFTNWTKLKCFIFSHMNIKWKWKYRVFFNRNSFLNLMRFCASRRTCWIKYWKWGNFKSIE